MALTPWEQMTVDKLRREKEKAELADYTEKQSNSDVGIPIKKISTYIMKVWQQNQTDNKHVRAEMIRHLRRTRGEYEPQKLANIKAFKGSEIYIRNSENKCRSAESWIKDIYRGDNDLPWVLEPTELPDVPANISQQIQQEIYIKGQELQLQLEQQAAMSGVPFDPQQVVQVMQKWQEESEEQYKIELSKEAKEKCKNSEKTIRDQNQECNFNAAFEDCLWYFVRTKAGILKGPILTKKAKQQWQLTESGDYAFIATDTLVPDTYAVSPFNFYPSRNMAKIGDGDTIEIHKLSKKAISDLIGTTGYDDLQIKAVLDRLQSGSLKPKWLVIEDETLVKQVEREKNLNTRPTTGTTIFTEQEDEVYALEFYGTIQGDLLIDWGVKGNIDPHKFYQCNCWQIDKHVIKVVLNPDPIGRKPYHISSWAKSPHWIWGESLHEMAEPIEDMLNAIARALQNNVGIASGPQVEINIDRCDDKTALYPWKRWYSTSLQMKEGPAINFYQPNMHVQELITAYQHFSRVLDELTVPAYAQGAAQSGVTNGTATVFTQLLAAASRALKAVVANIDNDIITPYIQMCYDYNMKYTSDDSIKGDARVVAKGVSGLLAKEQEAQRKVEYLQAAANPVFSQILGSKNIGAILAQIAKANNIHLPDMERLSGDGTLEDLITEMLKTQAGVDPNQMTGQMGAGGTPQNAQNLLPNGAEQGVVSG